MTKDEKAKARRDPLARPGGQGELDPAVRATQKQGAIKRGEKRKVTLWLTVEIYERMRALSVSEIGSDKALSDIARILLEQGLGDYDAGKLKFTTAPVIVRRGLVRG